MDGPRDGHFIMEEEEAEDESTEKREEAQESAVEDKDFEPDYMERQGINWLDQMVSAIKPA